MPTTAESSKGAGAPTLRRLTPVLVVDSVEHCIPFWIDRLGFALTMHVPADDGSMTFAVLAKGDIEIMYQTMASVLADGSVSKADVTGHSITLFIGVDSIDDVERAIVGAPIVKARHDTFYGSTEIYVKEPGGNSVGFAEMH